MEFNLQAVSNIEVAIKNAHNITLHIKREDRIHPIISGNKYRKLKYNLEAAKHLNKNTLLTFGGAFSNHIAATAAAGKVHGFKTIGVIRGEELSNAIDENATLKYAQDCGMQFKFVSRSAYKTKDTTLLDALKKEFGDYHYLPEGGTNALALKGCEEILTAKDSVFDVVCTAVGTGGTIAGIINGANSNQQILGFSALKGDFLKEDISKLATKNNWKLNTDYHFGGYAKINEQLITFINAFKAEFNIALDPVYTGKMLFGILDLIDKGYFKKDTKILAIHTGGLQGIKGMNALLTKKKLPLIHI